MTGAEFKRANIFPSSTPASTVCLVSVVADELTAADEYLTTRCTGEHLDGEVICEGDNHAAACPVSAARDAWLTARGKRVAL